jgi:integrase
MTDAIILASAIVADDENPLIADLVQSETPQSWEDSRNPASAYLMRLGVSSRRVMRGSLITLAHLCGARTFLSLQELHEWPLFYPWYRLRYAHTLALHNRLQQPILRPQPANQRGRPPVDSLAPATIRRHLAALSGVLKECWRLGLMGVEDYHRAIDLPNVPGQRPPAGRALSPGEILALLHTCARDSRPIGRRDQAMIAVLYGGGLRRSEVSGLMLSDYDPTTGALTIRDGKGKKDRTAYLPAGARTTLNAWLSIRFTGGAEQQRATQPIFTTFRKSVMTSRAINEENLYEMIEERCRSAHIEPCRPHDFRRTFIGDLLSAGVDIAIVQRLVGHADPGTTTKYDRRPEEAKAQAVEKLYVPFVQG